MSDPGVATRDYIESSEIHFGNTTDANGDIDYHVPWYAGFIGVEAVLGEPLEFVLFDLPGWDLQANSYPIFIKEPNGSKFISELVSSAREYIETHAADHLAEPSSSFLNTLENYGVLIASNDLPPFEISINGEDSLLIQWPFSDCRIGVVFEEDSSQSSWYILSDEKSDGMTAWGFLHKIGNPKLAELILNQISN